MKRHRRWTACLAAALMAVSCTAYKIKEMDGKALAAKGRKGRILSVETAQGTLGFSETDPVEVRNGTVLGSVRELVTFAPFDVAVLDPAKSGLRVVLKDGRRFRVAVSRPAGDDVQCLAVETLAVPLDEVVKAKVRVKDAAASILGTLVGAVLVVGALAIDAATYDDEADEPGTTFTEGIVDGLFEGLADGPPKSGRLLSDEASLGLDETFRAAEETEFWTMEWTPVEAAPGEDGRLRLTLENTAGVPRGIDEAKLVVVDHAPGVSVAPDSTGALRAISELVPPSAAADGDGKDVKDLVSAKDGVIWRTQGLESGEGAPDRPRDEITLSFPRPKGARKARLIVNAANSSWRAAFAREIEARAPSNPPIFQGWEYAKLRVRILTALSWQAGQALFATGPLPASDLVYDLDLGDVVTPEIWLKLSPPAGYWLIDRLALDFGEDARVEAEELAAEGTDGSDAAAVIEALAAEDGTTLRLAPGDPPALLTFALPPLKEGTERTVFLRTVSCYEMPAGPEKRTP